MGVLHELLLKVYRSVDNQEKYSLYLVEGSGLSKKGKKKIQNPNPSNDSRYSYKSSKFKI